MFVIMPLISTPVFLLILGVIFVGAIAFSIYYYFSSNKENFVEWKNTEFTFKQKLLWLLNLLVMFAAIYMTIYGFVNTEYIGAVGLLVWIFTSMAASFFCSPLKPFAMPDGDGKTGCAFAVFAPLMWLTSAVTALLGMFISWIFNLIVVFRKSKVWFKIVATLMILLVFLTPTAIIVSENYEEQKQIEETEAVEESILNKIEEAVMASKAEKIIFTEHEITFCVNEYETDNPLFIPGVNEKFANKLCELYNAEDFNGILNFVEFLKANMINTTFYITSEFESFLTTSAVENLEYLKKHPVSGDTYYSYENGVVVLSGDEIWFGKSEDNYMGTAFRVYKEKEKYYQDIYLVGETIEKITKE